MEYRRTVDDPQPRRRRRYLEYVVRLTILESQRTMDHLLAVGNVLLSGSRRSVVNWDGSYRRTFDSGYAWVPHIGDRELSARVRPLRWGVAVHWLKTCLQSRWISQSVMNLLC